MTVKILHNPRCSKSREALARLESRGLRPEIVDYLATPLSLGELRTLQRQLGVPARAMLREGEDEYRELGLSEPALSDDQLLQAVADHPRLLQRPIVVDGDRALPGGGAEEARSAEGSSRRAQECPGEPALAHSAVGTRLRRRRRDGLRATGHHARLAAGRRPQGCCRLGAGSGEGCGCP